jgi:hypothetical protein
MKRLIHFINILKASVLCILFLTVIAQISLAAPNAPLDPVVVPRYDLPITLVASWTDNSGDETGFEIERREEGAADFVSIDTVGINVVTYVDTTATNDRNWEYRIRALGGPAGDSAWTAVSNATSPKLVWPMSDGSHNVLDNYGHPLDSGGDLYFHDGVDITGGGVPVVAARGGIVTQSTSVDNGTVRMTVDVGAAGMFRDTYAHITNPDALLGVGDVLAPGDTMASVSNTFFGRDPEADHVHWETELSAGGGKISILSLYPDNADRDPNTLRPRVGDVNDDSEDFFVVDAAANDHNNPRDPAWGEVDLLVDAYDDLSADNTLVHSPHSVGYWIQALPPEGEDVQSAATPYKLLEHDFQLVGSPAAPEAAATNALYAPLPVDLQGIDTWQSYLTYVLTNTDDTDGDPADVDPGELWKTDARKGSGVEANGSDASKARENQDAKFPDGTYYVHIMLEDFVYQEDYIRSVLLDNSRPYVRRVSVFSGARKVYESEWSWDAAAGQLESVPAIFNDAAFSVAFRTQNITIEVEFSEPMTSASMTEPTPAAGVDALGVTPTLVSTQPANQRTIWRGTISNLDIADNGGHDGIHMITIDGEDLAGNDLLEINDRVAMGANHHNRDNGGNMNGDVGTDTIHGFRIGALEGTLPVTAIFMKQTPADPAVPIADKATAIQTALNTYFDEVSYGEIDFEVTGYGWYELDQPLDWYETTPQTPLVDLVQEAIDKALAGGIDLTNDDYVLVVTDENVARPEWSTSGAWHYDGPGGDPLHLSSGTLNLNSSDPHITNLSGRMLGLIDLFEYPEVTVSRPFVGPWSHMSDKENNVHVHGWEKWRVGWLDETGTATGNTLTLVEKPALGAPIVDQDHTLSPMDTDDDQVKMVSVEIAEGLYYTAEYRRQQNLDVALPDIGVVITKSNDLINQGEGPVIVQESNVTALNLDDAPHTTAAPRNVFNDVGSGVNIEVTNIDANQAQIRLNYTVPPTENDIYVHKDPNRPKSDDIWIDAPDAEGNFEADPLTVREANEAPVVGQVNKVYGRVRNLGDADATNFEVNLDIREPWAAGGPFRSLNVENVVIMEGQVNDPNAYFIISADWEPEGDVHSCVKLSVTGVANDVNPDNNVAQENISTFTTIAGSPFDPVTTRFEIENPYDETITVFFKFDGLPESWSHIVTPERLVLAPNAVGSAQVTLQPHEAAPMCSNEEVTISAYTPRVDTLKSLGAVVMQIGLKNNVEITAENEIRCSNRDPKAHETLTSVSPSQQICTLRTFGCTDPAQPNAEVIIIHTAPDGTEHVRYVTTDENGCYSDIITAGIPGAWETKVILEEMDCTGESTTFVDPVDVPDGITTPICKLLWWLFLIALFLAILFFAVMKCQSSWRYAFFVSLAIAIITAWLLLNQCFIDRCLFWITTLATIVLALLIILFSPLVKCFCAKSDEAVKSNTRAGKS